MPVPGLYRSSSRFRRRSLGSAAFRRGRAKTLGRGWALWWRLGVTAALAGAVALAALFTWASQDLPTPEGIVRRNVPQSTKIYDRTGTQLLYDIHGTQRRTAVELKAIPRHLVHATLVSEDRDFYNHGGFRLTSMLRAIIIDVLRGGKVQGGSTITQQFIKNAILTTEKSYVRKAKELILAYQIERKFSKDEILQLYLNEIPYGSNAYGVEAAAQTYFGKPVKDLTLAESAVLAAMAPAPTYYSPWGSHIDELTDRQHFVLNTMVSEGYITADEAASAKLEKLAFKTRREDIVAPHFVFYVKELLAQKYGERLVEQGGLKITTSLDLDKQKLAEAAVAASAAKNRGYNAGNAALVALDVPTSQILAMVGSRDYFDDTIQGQVNVAVRPRQPGSSFKPVVYSTAFTAGFTPDTTLFDITTTFKTDTTPYTPPDYDGKERGPVTLRKALAGSLNIPAVKLLYLTGLPKVLDTAERLGYTSLKDRSRFGLSLVLGGAEVSLLEHTAAYAALAREGIAKPVVSILKVEDPTGTVLEQYQDNPGARALDPEPVRQLTNILTDNEARAYIFGSQNRLVLPDRPVAAKTGTTNDYHDAWTMGFTPELAVGVWVGNSNNKEMKKGADGSVVAAPIWQDFFSQAVAGTPVREFTPPQPRTTGKPVLDGNLGGAVVDIDLASGKLASELTPATYRAQRVYRQYHTILTYITPGDPLGPAPANPQADPQYQTWEAGVRRWATEQGVSDEYPPTSYDDLHTEANRPQLELTSPTNNTTVRDNPATFSVQTFSPRGVRRVVYALDGQIIGTTTSAPWSLTFPVTTDIANGFHTLSATAYDDIDNARTATVTLNLLVTPLPSLTGATFNAPSDGQQLSRAAFPFTVRVTATGTALKQLDLYATPEGGQSQWLGVAQNPVGSATFTWEPPPPGRYTLSLTATATSGQVASGPRINIEVVP